MVQLEIKFDRGLNTSIDFLTQAPGHCLSFTDYQLDNGILRPRTTMNIVNASVIGSSSHLIDGVFYWVDNSQASLIQNGNLYINDNTGGKFYRSGLYAPSSDGIMTLTDITNSVAQNSAPISFASLNGILVYTGNGGHVNQITSHTANCATVPGVPVSFGTVRTVNNLMFGTLAFFGGNTTVNSTVYWSAVSDPTTWPAASNITFRNNDGDLVVALGELNGSLLIFKQLSIGLLNTTFTNVSGTVTLGPLTTLFTGIGALGPCCIDTLPDGRCVFWGSDYNVYVTDGATLTSLTNNPLPGPNIIDSLSVNAPAVNYSYLKYFPLRNEIVVAATMAQGTICFAYDICQKYWRSISGINPYSMCAVKNSSNGSANSKATSAILIGNNKGNVVDLARDNNFSPSTQDGSTIPATSVSASIPLPTDFFNSGLLCLTILYGNASGGTLYQTGFDNVLGALNTLPTSGTRLDIKIPLPGSTTSKRPSSFQIVFSNNLGATFGSCYIQKVLLSDEVTA